MFAKLKSKQPTPYGVCAAWPNKSTQPDAIVLVETVEYWEIMKPSTHNWYVLTKKMTLPLVRLIPGRNWAYIFVRPTGEAMPLL